MFSIFKRVRWSWQNGLIVVSKDGEVFVDGYRQTSIRYPLMWLDAFAQCGKQKDSVHRILMLGMAGGGTLPAIGATYPESTLTVIEHDPAMVELARQLRAQDQYPFPQVIVADAQAALPNTEGLFDLIIVDIFNGRKPSGLVHDHDFWNSICSKLAQSGKVIFNVAARPEDLKIARQQFAFSHIWNYDLNVLGAFWN